MHHRLFRSHLSLDTQKNFSEIIPIREKKSEFSTYVAKMKHKVAIFFIRTAVRIWHSFCCVVCKVLIYGFCYNNL